MMKYFIVFLHVIWPLTQTEHPKYARIVKLLKYELIFIFISCQKGSADKKHLDKYKPEIVQITLTLGFRAASKRRNHIEMERWRLC